jgi:hypothetical protein
MRRGEPDVALHRRALGENRGMTVSLAVLVMLVEGKKEFYRDAHIAGVREGKLIIAGGPARMNGLDPITDVRGEIPLAQINRVELLEHATEDD